jgi:hypothetical protein
MVGCVDENRSTRMRWGVKVECRLRPLSPLRRWGDKTRLFVELVGRGTLLQGGIRRSWRVESGMMRWVRAETGRGVLTVRGVQGCEGRRPGFQSDWLDPDGVKGQGPEGSESGSEPSGERASAPQPVDQLRRVWETDESTTGQRGNRRAGRLPRSLGVEMDGWYSVRRRETFDQKTGRKEGIRSSTQRKTRRKLVTRLRKLTGTEPRKPRSSDRQAG